MPLRKSGGNETKGRQMMTAQYTARENKSGFFFDKGEGKANLARCSLSLFPMPDKQRSTFVPVAAEQERQETGEDAEIRAGVPGSSGIGWSCSASASVFSSVDPP